MGTLTITAAGFANLPATPPDNWPANVTYPTDQSPNGSKDYTITDADWQSLLTWVASTQSLAIGQTMGTPQNKSNPVLTPTAAQILLTWLQVYLVNPTVAGIQQFNMPPPVIPEPISMQ